MQDNSGSDFWQLRKRPEYSGVLVCDEFAFLKPGIEEEFLQSVFPVVSSSKTSKIIIVSTPNGMGNEFYRIYSKATLDVDESGGDERSRWTPVRVDWWDVPGRDEKWKQQQLATFNGDEKKFNQEYGNGFLGSTETLIDSDTLAKVRDKFMKDHLKANEVQLHKDFPKTKVKIYRPPQPGHAYLIGADPAMGTASDYHAMNVFDVTNTYDIKHAASYYDNETPPKIFAYMLAKIGTLYNNAYIAMECNGCSQVTIEALWRDFEYEYIISEGGRPTIGIHSNNNRKVEGCMALKAALEDPMRQIEINDGRLISEMETFERKLTNAKMPTYAGADGHDDFIMSMIWCMFCLKMEIIERYYDVAKVVVDSVGNQIPLYIVPLKIEEPKENDYMADLDERLSSTRGLDFTTKPKQMTQDDRDMEDFIRRNNLSAGDPNDEESMSRLFDERKDSDEFSFGGFFG